MQILSEAALAQVSGGVESLGVIGAAVGTTIGLSAGVLFASHVETHDLPFFNNPIVVFAMMEVAAIGLGFALGAVGEAIQQEVNN